MKVQVYLDANVYLAYFLGEKDNELVNRLLRTSLGCRFFITASTDVYREIQLVCGNDATLLVQDFLDSFQSKKKLRTVIASPLDLEWASNRNNATGRVIGLTDWTHIRLASIYCDVLVSNDRMLRQLSVPWVRCLTVEAFLESLKS